LTPKSLTPKIMTPKKEKRATPKKPAKVVEPVEVELLPKRQSRPSQRLIESTMPVITAKPDKPIKPYREPKQKSPSPVEMPPPPIVEVKKERPVKQSFGFGLATEEDEPMFVEKRGRGRPPKVSPVPSSSKLSAKISSKI